jgi:hypothetical protein
MALERTGGSYHSVVVGQRELSAVSTPRNERVGIAARFERGKRGERAFFLRTTHRRLRSR